MSWNINRRRFLETASAALAMSALGADGVDIVLGKVRRVALIGTGWYGKSDVFRLIQVAHAEICCYYHMRANGNPPVQLVPDYLDYEMWTGPAPLRPYDGLPHKRWWRTFREYGNGIVGDMCVHMLDTVRWMLRLGWPHRISSTGGIFVQKEGKSNISDTQIATFEYDDLTIVWQHRSWGDPPDPEYPWALTLFGDEAATKLLRRPYRHPWKHPEPDPV